MQRITAHIRWFRPKTKARAPASASACVRTEVIGRRSALVGMGSMFALSATTGLGRTAVHSTGLAYVEHGDGEPLILVHGGLQDYRFWRRHMEILGRDRRVIAYSRRNHWPNPPSGDGLPDNAAGIHADDLAAFLDALRVSQAHVVAHSSGAHAALFFAHRHPARLKTLIVNEPPAGGLLAEVDGGANLLHAFNAGLEPARIAFRGGKLETGIRLFKNGVSGPGTYERSSRGERRMMLDNVGGHLADARALGPRPRFTSAMTRTLAMPMLVTSGTDSPRFFHRIADELARSAPHAKRVDIPRASHTVPTDNAPAFLAAVQSFLSSHG